MPSRFVSVRARARSSPTVTGSSVTNRMQFSHMAIDTSQGPSPWLPAPKFVVRCGSRCSASLSNSIVHATSTWDNRADRDRVPAAWGTGTPGVPTLEVVANLGVPAALGLPAALGPALATSEPGGGRAVGGV